MNKNIPNGLAAFVALGALLCAPAVHALALDYSGSFDVDNDVAMAAFQVTSDTDVTVFSSSWIADIMGLGFDPVIQLWDGATGDLIVEQNDGGLYGTAVSNGVTYSYGERDVYFNQFLTAGSYIATLVQFDNQAAGANLADGFVHDDNAAFTRAFGFHPYFNGVEGTMRSGEWSFHIVSEDDTLAQQAPLQEPIPEPASLTLLGVGVAGLALRRHRARR